MTYHTTKKTLIKSIITINMANIMVNHNNMLIKDLTGRLSNTFITYFILIGMILITGRDNLKEDLKNIEK